MLVCKYGVHLKQHIGLCTNIMLIFSTKICQNVAILYFFRALLQKVSLYNVVLYYKFLSMFSIAVFAF